MAEKNRLRLVFANGEDFTGNCEEVAKKFNDIISDPQPMNRAIQLTKAKAVI